MLIERTRRKQGKISPQVTWHDQPVPFLTNRASIAFQDTIHVFGMDTRAGSRLPPDVLAGEEASVSLDRHPVDSSVWTLLEAVVP